MSKKHKHQDQKKFGGRRGVETKDKNEACVANDNAHVLTAHAAADDGSYDPESSSYWTIVGMILAFTNFILSLVTDVLKVYKPVFPANTVLMIGTFAAFGSGPVIHYAGLLQHQGYELFQPFEGGATFVLLQMFGWTMYGCILILDVVVINHLHEIETYGIISMGGIACLLATGVLVKSLSQFEQTKPTEITAFKLLDVMLRISSSNHERRLSLIMSFLSCAAYVTIDVNRTLSHFPVLWLSIIATLLLVCASLNLHPFAGAKMNPSYQFWQPFLGGWRYVMMQAVGWTTLGVILLLTITFLPYYDLHTIPAGMISLLGIFSVIGIYFLAMSLDFYDGSRLQMDDKCGPLNCCVWSPESLTGILLMLSGMLLLTAVRTADIQYTSRMNVSSVELVGALGLLVSTLVTHFGGKNQYQHYNLWQPFHGGFNFIACQAFGWTFYAVGVGLFFIYLSNMDDARVLRLCSYGIALNGMLAEIMVFISLSVFEDTENVNAISSPRPYSWKARKTSVGRCFDFYSWQGEMLFALLIGVASCMFNFSVEIVRMRNDVLHMEFPATQIVAIAGLGFMLSALASHISGYRYVVGYKLFQPFRGGRAFVMMQAFGWFFLGVTFALLCFVSVNDLDVLPSGMIALIGVTGLLTDLLLLSSLHYFEGVASPDEITADRALINSTIAALSKDLQELDQLLKVTKSEHINKVLKTSHSEFTVRLASEQTKLADLVRAESRKKASPSNKQAMDGAVGGETVVSIMLSVVSFGFFLLTDGLRYQWREADKAGCTVMQTHTRETVQLVMVFATISSTLTPFIVHSILGPRVWKGAWEQFMPYQGGNNFVILQAFAWVLLSISSLVICPAILRIGVVNIYFDGMVTLAGVMSFMGQLVLLFSVHVFEATSQTNKNNNKPSDVLDDEYKHEGHESAVGGLMVTMAMLVIGALEFATHMIDVGIWFLALPTLFCGVVAVATIPFTYIIVGRRKHKWVSVWDPFKRGTKMFVHLQLMGWSLFSISFILSLMCLDLVVHEVTVPWLPTLTGILGFSAHLVISKSIDCYEDQRTAKAKEPPSITAIRKPSLPPPPSTVVEKIDVLPETWNMMFGTFGTYTAHLITWTIFVIVVALTNSYAAHMTFAFCFFRPFAGNGLGGHTLLVAYVCLVAMQVKELLDSARYLYAVHEGIILVGMTLYGRTWYQHAHWDGTRRWNAIRHSRLIAWFASSCEAYFSFRLKYEEPLSADKTYLFAYHPHGVYPFSLLWIPFCPLFLRTFPGVEMDAFTAGILLQVPWVRDLMMWMGARDVTRHAILHALGSGRSAFLVPGGQAEMWFSRSDKTEIELIYSHKGFIRLALQRGVPLVPVFAFGETEIFDNVQYPTMQNWFLRKFGFGYPHFPYGRWFMPIPRRKPLTVVIGKPLEVPQRKDFDPYAAENQEIVNETHKKYFEQMIELFEKHKHPLGYGEYTMVLKGEEKEKSH